jgi:hypothetical protein
VSPAEQSQRGKPFVEIAGRESSASQPPKTVWLMGKCGLQTRCKCVPSIGQRGSLGIRTRARHMMVIDVLAITVEGPAHAKG